MKNTFGLITGLLAGIVAVYIAYTLWNTPGYETLAMIPAILGMVCVAIAVSSHHHNLERAQETKVSGKH